LHKEGVIGASQPGLDELGDTLRGKKAPVYRTFVLLGTGTNAYEGIGLISYSLRSLPSISYQGRSSPPGGCQEKEAAQ
jgi:hypothetical protein